MERYTRNRNGNRPGIKETITKIIHAEEYSKYMCDYQADNPKSILFNLPILYKIPKETDDERLTKAFESVCRTHPMLQSVFEKNGSEWEIIHCPSKVNPVAIYETKKLDISNLIRPFKLGECVYRFEIIHTENEKYLFMDFFHGAIDGTGLNVFHRELGKAYAGEALEEDKYFECRRELEAVKNSKKYLADKEFLETKYGSGEYATIPTPDSNINGEFATLEFEVPDEVKFTNATSLEAVLRAMAEYNGCDKVMATWTYHSRNNEKRNDCIGLFIRDIPVGIDVRDDAGNIREVIAEGKAHKDYQWALTSGVQVLYTTFQGNLLDFTGIPGIGCERIDLPEPEHVRADDPMDIHFIADRRGKRFVIKYDSGMYRASSVERFGKLVQTWYSRNSIK